MANNKKDINIDSMKEGHKYTVIFKDTCNTKHQITGIFNKHWRNEFSMPVQKRIGNKLKTVSACEYIMITKKDRPVIIDIDRIMSIKK